MPCSAQAQGWHSGVPRAQSRLRTGGHGGRDSPGSSVPVGTALAPVRLHTVPSVKSARLAHHVHPSPATEQRPPPPSGPLPRDLRVPVVKDDWRGLCRGTGPPHGAVSRWGHGPRGAARGHSSLPLLQAPSGVTGSHPEPGRRREPAASPAIPEESGSRVLGGLAQGWWPAPRGTWDWAHTSFKGPVCSTPRGTSWSWSAPCCGDQEGLGLPLTLNPHTAPQPCSAPRKDSGTAEAPAGLQGGGAGTWRLLEEPSSGPRAPALLSPAQDPALCLGLGAAPLGLTPPCGRAGGTGQWLFSEPNPASGVSCSPRRHQRGQRHGV